MSLIVARRMTGCWWQLGVTILL